MALRKISKQGKFLFFPEHGASIGLIIFESSRTSRFRALAILRPLLLLGLLTSPWHGNSQSTIPGATNPIPADVQSLCSDPIQAAISPGCSGSMDQLGEGLSGLMLNRTAVPGQGAGNQLYVDSAGLDQRRNGTGADRAQLLQRQQPEPPTDFQRLVRSSTGESLEIFGRSLFQRPPSTFAPTDQVPATNDYVLGPGDQVLVRFWGPETFNSQLTVDTSGSIYIPRVGAIHVAGLRYDELEAHIRQEMSRIYRKFDLSVNLGRLRSIQIYVVGEARWPGAYTVSALSRMVNALFESGGPSSQGSMRRIELRRSGQPVRTLDLYDLLLRGDKDNDVRLEEGDVLFIPPVAKQAALAGGVRLPAIYELRDGTTLGDLLNLAGGFSTVATTENVSLERIGPDHLRRAMTVSLDPEGRKTVLDDGDVVLVKHISPGYEKSVIIRGNLANPGRFAWHPGMRLADIIPDRMSLLTNDYWAERNQLGVPAPLFQPLPRLSSLPNGAGTQRYPDAGQQALPGQYPQGQYLQGNFSPQSEDELLEQQMNQARRTTAAALAAQSQQLATSSTVDKDTETTLSPLDNNSLSSSTSGLRPKLNRVEVPSEQIDWSYAVIERMDPDTLKNLLLPFNLGKLVQDHDSNQNLELQPGDVVTILSQADIPVALEQQTKYIRLEGEFMSAGIYSVGPDETLADVVRRSGGLTPKAYLYGSSFLRVSARNFQQQRLNEYITRLSADMNRSLAVRAASSSTGISDPTSLAAEQNIMSQLRSLRATGRIVLNYKPNSQSLNSIPDMPLENGDVFRVPSQPNTVGVIGAVYGQNVFLYNSKYHLSDYLDLAGQPNHIADTKHSFIIRADGSIVSREHAKGFFINSFDGASIHPGDAIVVPEKMIKPDTLRVVMEYSQILSSFGIVAAALNGLQ